MDPQLAEKIVHEVKSQGAFDEFRKDCMSDVDTKPAYQNLRQRVESSVKKFLSEQRWTPETNKYQLRERLRRHITESGFLDVGVERIVDQVVNPKIGSIFQPKIEEIAYKYLGVPQPPQIKYEQPPPPMIHPLPPLPLSTNSAGSQLKVETSSFLPHDLEQISPDSDKATVKSECKDDEEQNESSDMDLEEKANMDDDDESPPFEPLIQCSSPKLKAEALGVVPSQPPPPPPSPNVKIEYNVTPPQPPPPPPSPKLYLDYNVTPPQPPLPPSPKIKTECNITPPQPPPPPPDAADSNINTGETTPPPPPPPLPPLSLPPPPPQHTTFGSAIKEAAASPMRNSNNTSAENMESETPDTSAELYYEKEASRSLDAAVSQESQLSQVSSGSIISSNSTHFAETTAQSNGKSMEDAAVNISEEAQMPKFNENSSDANGMQNSSSQLHFDIKKDEIKFQGTERKTNLLPSNVGNSDFNMHQADVVSEMTAATDDTISGGEKKEDLVAADTNNSFHYNNLDEDLEAQPPTPAPTPTAQDSSFGSSLMDDTSSAQLQIVVDKSKNEQKSCDLGINVASTSTTASNTTATNPPQSQSQSQPKRDRDKDRSGRHSSSSSSRHRKHSSKEKHHSSSSHEKDKYKSLSKDRERSRDSHSRTKHSSSSSSHKRTSSSAGNKSSTENTNKNEKSSIITAKQNSSSSSPSSRSESHDLKRERRDTDKRHSGGAGGTSSSSSRDKKSERKSTGAPPPPVDDHNESKEKTKRRKSTDSNDDEGGNNVKTNTGTDASSNQKSAVATSSASGKLPDQSKPKSKSSNDTSTTKSHAQSDLFGNENVTDENANTHHHHLHHYRNNKVVILNDILQNPTTDFIDLDINSHSINHVQVVRSSSYADATAAISPTVTTALPTIVTAPPTVEANSPIVAANSPVLSTTVQAAEENKSELLFFESINGQFAARLALLENAMYGCREVVNNLRFNRQPSEQEEDDNYCSAKSGSTTLCGDAQTTRTLVIDCLNYNGSNSGRGSGGGSCFEHSNDFVNTYGNNVEHPPKRFKRSNNSVTIASSKTSPTPSDISVNSKENEIIDKNSVNSKKCTSNSGTIEITEKRAIASANKLNQQRYSSEDLYKPRPVLSQKSRRRGMDAII